MEAAGNASDALCLNLMRTLELLDALTGISAEKEAYVTAGDIENLRAATEKEEELIAELGKQERDREFCAGALSEAIGLFDKKAKLSSLIEAIPDSNAEKRLTGLKHKLNEAINKLGQQNDKLSQLLDLQISYTDYMLNLMYIPRSRSHTYDIQGSMRDVSGELSFLDLHV